MTTNVKAVNKMKSIEDRINKATRLSFSSPVTGIEHPGLATWYAMQVDFNSSLHDPDKYVKFLVTKYEKEHRDSLFFKNGRPKKLKNIEELYEKIVAFIEWKWRSVLVTLFIYSHF